MNDAIEDRFGNAEWNRWRDLCKILEATGAVTRADLESKVGSEDTPGQKIIYAIQQWGEALDNLRTYQAKHTEVKP